MKAAKRDEGSQVGEIQTNPQEQTELVPELRRSYKILWVEGPGFGQTSPGMRSSKG